MPRLVLVSTFLHILTTWRKACREWSLLNFCSSIVSSPPNSAPSSLESAPSKSKPLQRRLSKRAWNNLKRKSRIWKMLVRDSEMHFPPSVVAHWPKKWSRRSNFSTVFVSLFVRLTLFGSSQVSVAAVANTEELEAERARVADLQEDIEQARAETCSSFLPFSLSLFNIFSLYFSHVW